MRIILDENLPQKVKEEIQDLHSEEDIMITRDKELHKNLLKIDKNSVYYDIEIDNLIEVQIKLFYYLKGYNSDYINKTSPLNKSIESGPNSLLRKRFEELKKENSELKSRVNVLEGKIKSVLNTAESAFEE